MNQPKTSYNNYIFKVRYCNYCKCYACGEEICCDDGYMVTNSLLCLDCLNKLGIEISNLLKLCEVD